MGDIKTFLLGYETAIVSFPYQQLLYITISFYLLSHTTILSHVFTFILMIFSVFNIL
jgi:hypothetical protein